MSQSRKRNNAKAANSVASTVLRIISIRGPLPRKCPRPRGCYTGNKARQHQRTAQGRVTGNQLGRSHHLAAARSLSRDESLCASARLFGNKIYGVYRLTAPAEPQNVSRAGRPPGSPNKLTLALRDRIEREADPIGFHIAVAKGEAIEAAIPIRPDRDHTEKVKIYPTLEQRMTAHAALLRKLVPDAKSIPVKARSASGEQCGWRVRGSQSCGHGGGLGRDYAGYGGDALGHSRNAATRYRNYRI